MSWRGCFFGCNPYWGPMVWSPNNSHLAFSVQKDYDSPPRLFIVDTNGNNLREPVNLGDQTKISGSISDIWWSLDSRRIYFNTSQIQHTGTTDSFTSASYMIPIEEKTLEEIPHTYPPHLGQQEQKLSQCNDREVMRYTTNQQGFVAQEVCIGSVNTWFGCDDYELQICNLTTNQVTFSLSYNDILKKDHPIVLIGLKATAIFGLIIGFSTMGKMMIAHSKKHKQKRFNYKQ
jgi:hypothetical protein